MTLSTPDLTQLAQEWPLTDQLALPSTPSIVVAGCYQGKLIRLLAERYPTYFEITGFEPQYPMAEQAMANTKALGRVTIYPFGLLDGPGEASLPMGEFETDACTTLCRDRVMGLGRFEDAAVVLEPLLPLDLFVMNMEGMEYLLLPYLYHTGVLRGIKKLAVQFHTKYQTPDAGTTLSTLDHLYRRVVDDFPSWVLWGDA